jgi:RNA polymerase sigma factor (sigma-70 family)
MANVTELLDAIQQGQPQAAEELLPLVYDELRRLARQKLTHEKPGQTLQATALVHEAYLRLVGSAGPAGREAAVDGDSRVRPAGGSYSSRGHFFAAAAEAMRRILIESARRKKQGKRGGDRERIDLDAADAVTKITPDQLLVLDESLALLERQDADAARIFKLCYFTGCSVEEAGELAGVSRATAYRHWTFARAWLLNQLRPSE